MTEIAALGLKADSSSLVVATEDLKKLSKAAGEAEQAAERLAPAEKKAGAAAGEMGDKARRAATDTKKLGDDSRTTEGALHRLAERAGTVAGTLVAMATAAFSVGAYVRLADSWSDMRSTLGAAIGDMDAASGMMNRMLEIAQASYSPLDQTVAVYARNVAVLRDLGKNAGQAADFTESLNHMLVITATKGERAASVQDALSKAMATGRLQADGLETVLANGGRVAQALADELGTTVSGLRDFASQGKITGQVIADAIIKPLEDVRDVAGSMDATIADGFTKVGNSLLAVVGNFDQATGASIWFATKLDDLSKWLTALSQTDFASWAASATDALTLLGQTLLVLAATRIPAAIAALVAFNYASVASTAAMAVQAGAARALGTAMALVGGPVGLAAAGLAALGFAWYNARSVYETAASATDAYKVAQEGLNGALQNFHESQSQQTLRALQEAAKGALDAAAQVVKAQEALLQAAQAQAGGTLGIGLTGGIVTQAMLDEDTARIAAAQEALAAARNALIQASFDYTASMSTAVDGAVAAVTATQQLSAEQQKALASSVEMERSYQQRAQLAQAEQQYGRDSAQYMQLQLQYEREIQHAKIAALDISNQQKATLRGQYDEMMRLEAKTQGWKVEIGKLSPPLQAAYDWLVKIRDTQPGDSWLSTAISRATDLAAKLLEAVGYTNILAEKASPQNTGSTDWYKDGNGLALGHLYMPSGVKGAAGGAGGGGGGGGSDQFAGNLQSLIESLETEQATVDAWYESSKAILMDRRAEEILGLTAHNAAKLALEEEYQQRLREMDLARQNERLSGWSGAFGDLASLMQSGNDRLFRIGQAAALAQATVDGYAAATSAWEKGMKIGGPPVASAFTAMSLARTGAMIASIASAGKGARGGAGSGGASASSAVTSSVPEAPLRVSADAFDPAQLYTGEAVQKWFDAIQKEAGNRGITWVPV